MVINPEAIHDLEVKSFIFFGILMVINPTAKKREKTRRFIPFGVLMGVNLLPVMSFIFIYDFLIISK